MKDKILIGILVLMIVGAGIYIVRQNGEEAGNTLFSTTTSTGEVPDGLLSDNQITEVEYPDKDYLKDLGTSTKISNDEEILITSSGTYEFSGTYINSIVVNVDKTVDTDPVYLVLNGVTINTDNTTPINILEAKDVVIVVEENTTNTITQANIVTDDEDFPNAAIYSKADLAIVGSGELKINTLYNDGINSRDDLVIEDAAITISAKGDGIVGKDLVAIDKATIEIVCENDGIKSTNSDDETRGYVMIKSGTFDIDAKTDGISASTTLQIEDGTFNIVSGGGFEKVLNEITLGEGSNGVVSVTSQLESSMKGLKGLNILLNGGKFEISSYEDTIHSDNDLTINGGQYQLLSGDDAVHAENILAINAGTIVVENGYEGLEGDIIIINGGDINVFVLDDAVNAGSQTGYLRITGGNIYLESSGDCMDSNGDAYVEGGTIVINNTAIYTGGDSAIDVSGSYVHTGGTVKDPDGNDLDASTGGGMSPGGMNQGGGRR